MLSALPALRPTGGTSDVAKLTSLIEMGALAIADKRNDHKTSRIRAWLSLPKTQTLGGQARIG